MDSMSSGIARCVLRSRNYKHRDVYLPHNSPVVIGRGPQTKIRERRCSKSQVEVTADYTSRKACVVQLGPNPSEVDDEVLNVQQKVEILHGSSINLLKDQLQYTLEFVSKVEKGGPHSKTQHNFKLSDGRNSMKTKHEESLTDDDSDNHHSSLGGVKRSEMSRQGESCGDPVSKKPRQDAGAEDISDDDSSRQEDISTKLAAMRESLANTVLSATTEEKWEEYDHSKLLIYTSLGLEGRPKAAAFDMDHTIICTQTGRVFPTSMDDWRIMYAEIPGKLKKLFEEGYKIVIFTNQKGISKGKTSVPDFKRKVKSIVKKIGIPIQVLVSTGSGRYRKPNTGMWDYFINRGNQGVPVDRKSCIYVGDAAGRPESKGPIKRKKDFSCADRLFALNANLKFFTPEEFFLGHKPSSFQMPSFDPRNVGNEPLAIRYKPVPGETLTEKDITASSLEVVVCVGFPASGKTHFVENYLIPKGYVHINRDTLGTWQKCLAECSKSLDLGKSVVIDNTNPDVDSRMRYIQCALKRKVPCRCFLFNCSREQAKHNNVFRELNSPDKKHVGVNDMVLNSYKSKYKEPTLEEGFTEILKINFVPKFKNRNDEELFRRFLIEK